MEYSAAITLVNTAGWQTSGFTATNAKYLKLKVTSTIPGSSVCSIAEIKLKGCPNTATDIAGEHVTGANLEIYPNPNSGAFNINIRFLKEENGSIRITDVAGRTVFQDEINTVAYARKINLEKGL